MKSSTHVYSSLCVGLLAACAVFLAGCADELSFVDVRRDASNGNTLQFNVATREMGDMMIGIGSTRAGQSASSREADAFTAKPLTGDNPYGLGLHRMPIPYVGIHSKAVRSSASQASATRASVDDIVKKDGTNFHDSLSIWGYTDGGTELFNGNLLMRITNWRSAVSWPYETGAFDPGNTMRFYAISPAMESLNISSTEDEPSYNAAPVFKLTLPESPSEMRDVLYGESDEISIPAGPDGSITEDPKSENIGQDNKHVDLAFSHILTAIRFAQGANFPPNVTVEKIRLIGIYASGIFDPNETDELTRTKGKWTILDENEYDYELTNLSTNVSGANTYIDGQQVLFMIPQMFGEKEKAKAKLEVELRVPKRFETDDDDNLKKDENGNRIPHTDTATVRHIVSCVLDRDVWKKGYTVTYRIGIGKLDEGYYLMVDAPEAEVEHSKLDIKGSFNVHSYHCYYDYSNNPLGEEDATQDEDWEVEGYYESEQDAKAGINKVSSSWLSITETGITDDEYKGNATYTISGATPEKTLKHQEILSSNSKKNAIDLSKADPNGQIRNEETANCYIVNRQGEYSFPLVYGNKKENPDEPADEPAGIVDHRGNVIAYRFIRNQITSNRYYGADEYTWEAEKLQAKIIWTDAPGLITNVKVQNISGSSTSSGEIVFEVAEKEVRPGNTVIALQYVGKGTPETLWTWHIWMTDEVYPNDYMSDGIAADTYYLNYNPDTKDHTVLLENYDGQSYNILPVNLGWVPDNNEFGVYRPREIYARIEQVVSGQYAIVHIKQHARQDEVTGTSTVYQWGRPTALQMKDEYEYSSASKESAGYHITNPDKLFWWYDANDADDTGKSVWFDNGVVTIPSYWTATEKSVYDPCPPGYMVPPSEVFTGLSRTGASNLYGSQLNTYPDVDGQTNLYYDAGGYFYTKKYVGEQDIEHRRDSLEKYPLVYFPVTNKNWDGVSKTIGIYWCADNDPSNRRDAMNMWLHPQWGYSGTDDDPAIQFKQSVNYSSAQAIRPVAVEPVVEKQEEQEE